MHTPEKHNRLMEYLEHFQKVLDELVEASRTLTERYSANTMTCSGESSWNAYMELRGCTLGLLNLAEDLKRLSSAMQEEGLSESDAAARLVARIISYRFSNNLVDEYGRCCLSRLLSIQSRLICVLEKGTVDDLQSARPQAWL